MGAVSAAAPQRIVVVGGGLAGLRVIEELRARGYDRPVTLVGAETRLPYDRPPLSKKLMLGELDDTTVREDLSPLGVDLRLGETATGIELRTGTGAPTGTRDPVPVLDRGSGAAAGVRSGQPEEATEVRASRLAAAAGARAAGRAGGTLSTDRGGHPFDALVLATGARPVALPGGGRQRFLRTIDDALALRELLRPGLRLVIVGAGWIGAELATAAAARGCAVTVVEAAEAPLSAALGAEVGGLTAAWYAAAGVELRLGQSVESVEPGGLALAGGGWLAADEIVTAVGVRPDVAWLDGSPVALANGVAVDGQLRTSVDGIYAVGDCAAFTSARYRRRLRVEHWDSALRAPAVVAASLLGGTDTYDPVPYFWSEQFGRMVQYIGYHGHADRLILRGDPAGQRWAACWLADGRLVAMATVNSPRDLLQGRRLAESGAPVDAGQLADQAVPVRDAAG